MIRLIQRKLIIPRGDTGTFSVPVLSTSNTGDVAVFTIFDTLTRSKVYQKQVETTDSVLTIRFEHEDTVNLPAGKFVWDIKFYQNPVFIDGELVSGNEVDSYYAAYSLPECEIRMTGDNLLTSDEAPTSTVSPMYLNIVDAAINDANAAKREATTAKNNAEAAAEQAAGILSQITGLNAEAISLQSTQSATANYDAETGVLTIGIPKGVGITSITKTNTSGLIDTYTITYNDNTTTTFTVTNGTTPVFSIGTVIEGATAAATITGTTTNPVLNLVLPGGNIPTKVSQLQNDSGFITTETDPTVPEWAKAANKPTYTAEEVGAYVKPANGIPASDLAAGVIPDISGKQDVLTFDNTPTALSNNPVTSSGIKSYVDTAISNINEMNVHICTAQEYDNETGIPIIADPDTSTFYLVPGGESNNLYIEWVYVNNVWERFGSADIDLSGYATKTDTELDTTLSRGRKNNTTVGIASVAFGNLVEASGTYSQAIGSGATASGTAAHAEGLATTASGVAAHAEGWIADATGDYSHAEGRNTTASGEYSHAEGHNTTASNSHAHTEGNGTVASGLSAHAEGSGTKAQGDYSHAEGRNTIANGEASHVSGTYNIEDSYTFWPEWVASTEYVVGDKVKVTVTENNETTVTGYICKTANSDASFTASKWIKDTSMNFAEIIGNGTAFATRSNARALSWDGNEYLAGDLYVQANNDSSGGTKVAKITDIPTIPANVSAFINDAGYLTSHQDISGKADKITGATNGNFAALDANGNLTDSGHKHSDYLTSFIETDPTVPNWAKAESKPTYTASEIGLGNVANERQYSANNPPPSDNTKQNKITASGILKGDGNGGVSAAVAGTDYIASHQDISGKADKVTSATNGNFAALDSNGNLTDSGHKHSDYLTSHQTIPVTNVQLNGTSILNNGVANVPVAGSSTLGVISAKTTDGLFVGTDGDLRVQRASSSEIKSADQAYRPITPYTQHESTFYGLAKAAGDNTQSASSNAVGTYTEDAKSKISDMLNSSISVSGSTPTITAKSGIRYVCGEVSTLTIVTPATGIIDVVFESGSTATVLTVTPPTGMTMKWANGFDPTSLEANTVYEINIMDGIYGVVGTWT